MRHNIAIIGAGITGVMTALACARRGANVELYDAHAIPNRRNLSWAYGRLWKHIHENNPALQPLAADSLPFWSELIKSSGEFGCRTHSLRLVDDATCERLAQLYQQLAVGYEIQPPGLAAQSSLLDFSGAGKHLFVGYDALLLNASKIYARLCHELTECRNVTLKPQIRVEPSALRAGTRLYIGKSYKEYQCIIWATSSPLAEEKQAPSPVLRYQLHLNVHLNDARAARLKPVLTMGDDNVSWCVPSPDRRVLKLSASRFSWPKPPDEACLLACKAYLLNRLRMQYSKVDVLVSPYFTLAETERVTTPYWHHHQGTGCIQVDACDASIFKIAPALSRQISHYAIHGVKE